MNIKNIIGKGKDFEPPFSLDSDAPLGIWLIDNNGKCAGMFPQEHLESDTQKLSHNGKK